MRVLKQLINYKTGKIIGLLVVYEIGTYPYVEYAKINESYQGLGYFKCENSVVKLHPYICKCAEHQPPFFTVVEKKKQGLRVINAKDFYAVFSDNKEYCGMNVDTVPEFNTIIKQFNNGSTNLNNMSNDCKLTLLLMYFITKSVDNILFDIRGFSFDACIFALQLATDWLRSINSINTVPLLVTSDNIKMLIDAKVPFYNERGRLINSNYVTCVKIKNRIK